VDVQKLSRAKSKHAFLGLKTIAFRTFPRFTPPGLATVIPVTSPPWFKSLAETVVAGDTAVGSLV
jgi:hypothetical protein